MFLLNRARGMGLRMLGFGFGAGDRSFEDSEKENESESPSSSPPWLKKQKIVQERPESSHSNLVQTICDQLNHYRTGRALRTMKNLPNFASILRSNYINII